jgi:hypothetical protein
MELKKKKRETLKSIRIPKSSIIGHRITFNFTPLDSYF